MNFVCGNPVVDLEPMAENRAEQLEYNEDLLLQSFPMKMFENGGLGFPAFSNSTLKTAGKYGSSLKFLPSNGQNTIFRGDHKPPVEKKKPPRRKHTKNNETDVNVEQMPGYFGEKDIQDIMVMLEGEQGSQSKSNKKSKKNKKKNPTSSALPPQPLPVQVPKPELRPVESDMETNPSGDEVECAIEDVGYEGAYGEIEWPDKEGVKKKKKETKKRPEPKKPPPTRDFIKELPVSAPRRAFRFPQDPQVEADINRLCVRYDEHFVVNQDNSITVNKVGELYKRFNEQAADIELSEEEKELDNKLRDFVRK